MTPLKDKVIVTGLYSAGCGDETFSRNFEQRMNVEYITAWIHICAGVQDL